MYSVHWPSVHCTLTLVLSALLVGSVLCCSSALAQQQTPAEAELRAVLKITQQKLAYAEARNKELSKSLAEAVRVSEEQAFAARDVREKLEALGVDLLNSSEDSLQQRLLKAVRDLDIMRQESERQRQAVHQLSEAFLKYIASTPEAPEAARGAANDAIAKAGRALDALVNSDQIEVKKLEKSQVIRFDSKIGLIVVDAGRKSGVRVGTPITIGRNDQPIYTALIVDVRDSICGALLQEKIGEASGVKPGDQVRPLATETSL